MNHPVPVLPTIPALPEPVNEDHEHEHEGDIPVAAIVDALDAAAAAAASEPELEDHHRGIDVAVDVDVDGVAEAEDTATTPASTKKRRRSKPLTFHEALTFASRGVYVDPESGQLRCSCNHKPCDKWDSFGYTRHFAFKVHHKYETQRLDDTEMARLRDCKEIYTRDNPIVEDPASLRKKMKMREGEKILNQEELRVQERHWMSMWKDAKNELRQLRLDLKTEPDEDVRVEMTADIEGLKRRKGDWARLLGLNEVTQEIPMTTAVPF